MSNNKNNDVNFEKSQYKKKSIYLLEQDIKNLKKRMNGPKVELIECATMYHIKIELPGVDKKSIKVQVREHQVVLISCTKPNSEIENSKVIYKEYTCGDFMRRIKLPSVIKYKHYTCDNLSYIDGILSLSFEKSNTVNVKNNDNDTVNVKNNDTDTVNVKNNDTVTVQSKYSPDSYMNKEWHEMD